jgi:hypothetical protein
LLIGFKFREASLELRSGGGSCLGACSAYDGGLASPLAALPALSVESRLLSTFPTILSKSRYFFNEQKRAKYICGVGKWVALKMHVSRSFTGRSTAPRIGEACPFSFAA